MILVTGATGFLGGELIHQLTLQGTKLVALKRETSVIPERLRGNPLIDWVIADINDTATLDELFEGITEVYHCAALVSFDSKDKADLLRVNIHGTSNMVNLCLDYGARLVHVSSVAALGIAKKGKLITENDYWEYDAKANTYAISKYEGEMEVWRGMTEGLSAVIINPSVIIGGHAGFTGSGAIFKQVKQGLSFYTQGSTGFVDVEDVAKLMIQLMARRVPSADGEDGERFIISAENWTYRDLLTAIAKEFNLLPPAKLASPWMMGMAWKVAKIVNLFTGKTSALTRDTANSSSNINLYSNDKIKNTIGMEFKPLSVSIAETCAALSRTV
ncbi:nucleoside-diphosphate-sugar epimerase [Pedobacter sp. CAN_A7]|uniref:NAD-dependent epimerase/dehydratase family protein n=1 Tax=Pedobacter sp. CAN_A7 TaxID=2787722 RepID=UPI0018C8FB9B